MKFKWDSLPIRTADRKQNQSCSSSSLLPLPTNHEIGLKIKNKKFKKYFIFLPPSAFELLKCIQVCSEALLQGELWVWEGLGCSFVCLFVFFLQRVLKRTKSLGETKPCAMCHGGELRALHRAQDRAQDRAPAGAAGPSGAGALGQGREGTECAGTESAGTGREGTECAGRGNEGRSQQCECGNGGVRALSVRARRVRAAPDPQPLSRSWAQVAARALSRAAWALTAAPGHRHKELSCCHGARVPAAPARPGGSLGSPRGSAQPGAHGAVRHSRAPSDSALAASASPKAEGWSNRDTQTSPQQTKLSRFDQKTCGNKPCETIALPLSYLIIPITFS